MKEKRINLNVSEEYHKEIKTFASQKGVSIRVIILRGLAMVIENDKKEKNDKH